MFLFGHTSVTRLYTCHDDWIKILEMAIRVTAVDFGIAEGHRPTQKQQDMYAIGRTKPGKRVTNIDGVNIKGKHNYVPSLAVDIYAFVNGSASWDVSHLSYLAGVIITCAEILYIKGEITHKVRWGGNWDRDGEILSDQSFDDSPHFELVAA